MNRYVLWLTSWYPSRGQPSNGDFVERHARAIAPYVPIIILLVEKDESLHYGESIVEKKEEGELIVFKAYYGRSSRFGPLEKLLSFNKYRQIQKRVFRSIVQDYGEPQLVHVHVAMKAGLLAWRLFKKNKIPYLLSEHWTGYYKTSTPNYYTSGMLMKHWINKIINSASLLVTVSDQLGRTIQQYIASVKYEVIPNVVDTAHFNYQAFSSPVFRFIHPSYLNYQKNPEGMIEAAALLAGKGYVFELYLLGNRDEKLEALAGSKGLLNKCVFIKPAVSYKEVAVQMKESSALLMFSRFENLPCVILEALCCGLPVISSRVGGIGEVINEKNGLLVENENVRELAAAMIKMMETYANYDREAISREAVKKYNYGVIGNQYFSWYKKISH